MVRDPVEMVHSWHYHWHFGTGETKGLEEAWETEQPRIADPEMRMDDGNLRFLKYRALASLGRRLEFMKGIIPPGQLMTIVYDDFVRDPKAVYEQVSCFIGVPADGRTEFPRVNQARRAAQLFLGKSLCVDSELANQRRARVQAYGRPQSRSDEYLLHAQFQADETAGPFAGFQKAAGVRIRAGGPVIGAAPVPRSEPLARMKPAAVFDP